MLESRNNAEPYKLKSYVQANSNRWPYQQDWQKTMQDKIDSFIKNKTWTFSILLSSTQTLQSKLVYKIKRRLVGEIL